MNFGEKIRTLRKDQNLSQTELAKRLQVSRRTVCSWENEGRFPKERRLIDSLAKILDFPVCSISPSIRLNNSGFAVRCPGISASAQEPLSL